MAQGAERLVAGTMSGTSLDGLDVAIARVAGTGAHLRVIAVVAAETVPLPPPLRAALVALMADVAERPLALLCDCNTEFAAFTADAVAAVAQRAGIAVSSLAAVGSHGQTVWHRDPRATSELPSDTAGATLQIGDGEVLAHRLGVPVAWNFRAADVAVGGSGAPLVPYFDRRVVVPVALRQLQGEARPRTVAVLNLGGIGNATLVDAAQRDVLAALDTGPANVVANEALEALARGDVARELSAALDHRTDAADLSAEVLAEVRRRGLPLANGDGGSFDKDGAWSRSGTVVDALLRRWQAHPYLVGLPSVAAGGARSGTSNVRRSTGREDFGATFVASELRAYVKHVRIRVDESGNPRDTVAALAVDVTADFVATAIDFSAWCVARVVAAAHSALPRRTDEADGHEAATAGGDAAVVLASGGGARNPELLRRIGNHLTGTFAVPHARVVPLADVLHVPGLGGDGPSLTDFKEALAFAVLANERLQRTPSNEPRATGATRQVVLGALSEPLR